MMYGPQSFGESYAILKKNWINLVPYSLPLFGVSLAVGIIVGIVYLAGIVSMGALKAKDFSGIGTGLLVLLALAAIACFSILMVISAFISLMSERVSYLTSKGAAVPISMATFASLSDYAKANFFSFFKLLLAMTLVSVAAMAAFFAVYLVLTFALGASGFGIGALLAMVPFAIAGLAVFFAIFGTMSTSRVLFFMGNENAGTIKLLGNGWSMFSSNLSEYFMFAATYLAISIVYFIIVSILGMVCLGPLNFVIGMAYGFFTSVSTFVFISHLLPQRAPPQTI